MAGNPRNQVHVVPCYGKSTYDIYAERPVLCSGTVLGNRAGMNHFLTVLVSEFKANNQKSNLRCKSPHTTDQWTMNWLYYNGKFSHRDVHTRVYPWGAGPILTIGKACMTEKRKQGAKDLITQDEEGFIMNIYDRIRSPVVHQHDRCGQWILDDVLLKHPEIYSRD